MQNVNNIEKIIYIDNETLEKLGVLSAVITMFIMALSLFFYNMTSDFIGLIYIVISFSIMILAYSTANILKNEYFKFFSITFFITAFVNMAELIPNNAIPYAVMDNFRVIHVLSDGLIAMLWIYTPYFIKNSNTKGIKLKYWITTFIIVASYFLLAIEIHMIYIFIVIANVIVLVLFVYSVISSRHFPVRKGNEVNYFKVYSYILLFFYIFNILELIFSKVHEHVFPYDFIKLAAYIIFYGCILQKLLNNLYVLLFNDLYVRNIHLNELNEKVSLKTMELEYSQKVIHEREELFRSLFKNIPQCMLIINISNGRISFSNTAFQNLLKKKNLKGIINRKITDLVKFSEEDLFGTEGSRIKFNEIYEGIIEMDGEQYHLEFQFVEVFQEEGQILVLINDTTEDWRIEKIKLKVEQKKIEEKIREDFLSSISHDLKTPLNVIYSANQLLNLLLTNGNYEEVKKYNAIAKDNCLSLIRLTNNLIDSSRLTSQYLKANMELCNIVEVIEDHVMNLAEYVKAKDVDLIFDTTEEEMFIRIDREFIERIILNLLSNALKYTPKGGEILVALSYLKDQVKIKIKDTGIGMDKKFLEEAFNRYSQGRNNSKINGVGNGIGLYVVKNLTELMGGYIHINSHLGIGTTITLSFKKE